MQHSITLLLGQIALTEPGGVLGHCPDEKQMIVPLSANGMAWDGISLQNAVVDRLIKCALNSLTVSPAKQSTYTASSMLHGENHTCGYHPFSYSASHKDPAVGTKNLKFELRLSDFHPPNVHCLCFFDQARLFLLLVSFSSGFFAAI